ncbi:hypothetical protein I203_104387 [Kwoniella mangroviensis CBS 8507]|uniref:uncharacterized protein n=1 Tax=Kwoniella mangroviensis CBS 8507 TaxID=1296122 RepID=UPI00080D14F7|nr:uncharacterized protein I203_00666 [Kwoniella mangroviensis CBS 8507]OCF70531.1 hypothetical protein I203_00666 [Kwoniella mangroviensis CBS 8507]
MNISSDLMSVESLKSVAPTEVETFLKSIYLMEKNVKELERYSQPLGALQMSMEGTLGNEEKGMLARVSSSDTSYDAARISGVYSWYKLGDPNCVEIQRAFHIHSRKQTVTNQMDNTILPYASNWLSAALDEIVQETNTISERHREFRQDPEDWKRTRGIEGLGNVHQAMRSYNQTLRAARTCSQALINKSVDELQESKAAIVNLSHIMDQVYLNWNDDIAPYKSESIQLATRILTELKSECEDFLRLFGSVPVFSIGDERSHWERELAASGDRLTTLYASAATHKEELKTLFCIVEPNHEYRNTCEAWGKITAEVKNAFKTLRSRGAQGSSLDLDDLASVLDDL